MAPLKCQQNLVDKGTVESVLKRGSSAKDAVRALQNMLHEFGFDAELNWEKYGADGDCGGGTTKGVKTFAERNGLSSDGETVTPGDCRSRQT